jgi:murein DD-endopeptidase MepM/ murein hydrolase activator NlpD
MQAIADLLSRSRFTEHLVRENGLADDRLAHWILRPGMLSGAPVKWWGDGGKRIAPHEGLDLCFYRDQAHEIHRLHPGTRIPAMYDGTVVRVLDDFLGRTVVIAHSLPEGDGAFYTIYGHIVPREGLDVDRSVREGEFVARLTDASRSRDNALPHLHVSLGWTRDAIAHHNLDWETIPHVLNLLDPLPALGGRYVFESL